MEQQTQSKIIKQLELNGYYVVKLIKTNKNGIPDLIAVKEKQCFFVEVKQPKGKLSEIQKYRIKEMQDKEIDVKIWTNYKTDFKL